MKKSVSTFLLLLSSTFVLASCGGDDTSTSEVATPTISLSQTSLNLEQYQSATLEATLNNVTGSISWTSSDQKVATVNNGVVNALSSGTCTITATINDLKAECSVTVTTLAQAPRIFLGESGVSIEKEQTYSFDAYVLYKNKKIDSNLELSLKDGEKDNIASISFANDKINVKGLAYGETSYIVHTKALGVTLSSTLNVKVSNSSLSLSVDNIEMNEEGYNLNLATYKVEDGYDTEFTPNILFKENGNDATYPLTYSSSDENIATWENGKIVAKKDGLATLKIECEEFAVKVEIKVHVYKGAYRVTLKNTKSDGSDDVQMIAPSKMPTTPTLENRQFAGWYNEDGDKVNEITDDMTLIARYTANYDYETNKILKSFSQSNESYEAVDGVEKLKVRSGVDRDDDIKNNRYPDVEGSVVFFIWHATEANAYAGEAAVRLEKYDFSKSEPVTFTFGIQSQGSNGESLFLEDHDLGFAASNVYNYKVTINGKNVSVHNEKENNDITFTLSDEVYTGQKGLKISATNIPYRYILVSPFKSTQCDYISACETIESALPETPTSNKDYVSMVKDYIELRKLYSEVENSIYPESNKMKTWVDALPQTILSFTGKAEEIKANAIGDTGQFFCGENTIQRAHTAKSLGDNKPFNLDEESFIAEIANLGYEKLSYVTFTLPAVNFSIYKEVSFEFGFGGNGGLGHGADWSFGNVPDSTTDLTVTSNYIGKGITTSTQGWELAGDMKAVISNGKITFNNSVGVTNKTFDLDANVNSGEKGLTFTVGNVAWEFMVFSPFIGTKL